MMATCMDEDLDDEPVTPFREDLTCPVCMGIFRDPKLLPCSHSFCRECLERCLATKSVCPVCRVVCTLDQAIINRALNHTCESYLIENWKPREKQVIVEHSTCPLHQMELQLYCVTDEEPVCVGCVEMHGGHQLLPITQGVSLCKEELSDCTKTCEKKVESLKKIKQQFTSTVEFIKDQASQAEKHIKLEFERLRQVLVTEEALRLKALATEEEQKITILEELIAKTATDITSLTEQMKSLQEDMETEEEDLPFLRNFKNLRIKAHWPTEDPELPYDCLMNMGKHCGSLSFNIWKNMQPHVKYNQVVLDPNTASPWLSLNADLTSVKESSERKMTPDNPERFDPCVFVMGAEGFTSGKHRWDINVGDNPKWIVGVCKESVTRKKKFTVSTDRGVWTIGLSKGVYTAMTPKHTVLAVEQPPETIRIKLNMDKGEVSFWDGGRVKHLCTFTFKFNEKAFPLFGPGLHSTPMIMAPGKLSVHAS